MRPFENCRPHRRPMAAPVQSTHFDPGFRRPGGVSFVRTDVQSMTAGRIVRSRPGARSLPVSGTAPSPQPGGAADRSAPARSTVFGLQECAGDIAAEAKARQEPAPGSGGHVLMTDRPPVRIGNAGYLKRRHILEEVCQYKSEGGFARPIVTSDAPGSVSGIGAQTVGDASKGSGHVRRHDIVLQCGYVVKVALQLDRPEKSGRNPEEIGDRGGVLRHPLAPSRKFRRE